jgi:hypothetical protein
MTSTDVNHQQIQTISFCRDGAESKSALCVFAVRWKKEKNNSRSLISFHEVT